MSIIILSRSAVSRLAEPRLLDLSGGPGATRHRLVIVELSSLHHRGSASNEQSWRCRQTPCPCPLTCLCTAEIGTSGFPPNSVPLSRDMPLYSWNRICPVVASRYNDRVPELRAGLWSSHADDAVRTIAGGLGPEGRVEPTIPGIAPPLAVRPHPWHGPPTISGGALLLMTAKPTMMQR